MTWSALLVYLGFALKIHPKPDYSGFWWVCLSAVFFHLAVNSITEYRDFQKGIDNKESKGASGLPLAVITRPRVIYQLGILCFIVAVLAGLIAVHFAGPKLLIPGIIAGILVFSYSEKPLRYKYYALGELSVFILFGPLLAFSCLFALWGRVVFEDLLISIPIGLLVAAVMLANNIRDWRFDVAVKNKTIATVLGLKAAYAILFFIVNLAFLIVLFLPNVPKKFLIFLTYPILFLSIKYIEKHEFFNVFLALEFAFSLALAACLFFG